MQNLVFTQTPAQQGTRQGTIDFDVPQHEGTAYVFIDADNDGSFTGPKDRKIPVQVVSGNARPLNFDGLDGQGQVIPGATPIKIRVEVSETGEVHFVDNDVEVMSGGITVARLNGPGASAGSPDYRISWDDSGLIGFKSVAPPNYYVATRCGVQPSPSSYQGTLANSNTANFLAFSAVGCGTLNSPTTPNPGPTWLRPVYNEPNFGTWGNLSNLDRWANVGSNAQATIDVAASTPTPCVPSRIYGVTDNGRVYGVEDTGGTATQLEGWRTLYNNWNLVAEGLGQGTNVPTKDGVNGLGIAPDGTMYAFAKYYQYDKNYPNTLWNVSIKMMVKDPGAGAAWRWLDPSPVNPKTYPYSYNSSAQPVAGAIDPVTGKYVWGGFKDGYFVIHEIDLATGVRNVTGRIAVGNGNGNNINGDITFDALGNLYVLSHRVSTGNLTITTVTADNLAAGRITNSGLTGYDAWPTVIPGSIAKARQTGMYNGEVNGIAVGSNGGLYIGTTRQVYRINPVTAQIIGGPVTTNPFPTGYVNDSTDLSSCADAPTTLTVQKDLRGTDTATRAFTLSVANGGTEITSTVATTRVPGTTVLKEKTGPTMVAPGDTFVLTETSPNLNEYDSTLSCRIDGVSGSAGVVPVSGTATTTGSLQIPAGAVNKNVTCTFVNTPKLLGSVIWQKVQKHGTVAAPEYTNLGGSEWRLVGPAGPTSADVAVTDCVANTAAGCTGEVDKDHRKGFFNIVGLAQGGYQLIETKAPGGFVVDATPHPFTVGANSGGTIVLNIDLGKIENRMMNIPGLPLTGGLGEQRFLIAAGLLAIAAIAGAAIRIRKQKANARTQ